MDTLKVPATMEHFDEIMAFLRGHAVDVGFEGEGVNKIALASEEAVVNVIHYAYAGGEGDIEVEVRELEGEGGIEIRLRDKGIPFNPLEREAPDIDAPVEERPIGGLGIFMVQQIMDDVNYERRGDENVFTMTKRLT